VQDIEKREKPPEAAAAVKEETARRPKTAEGKKLYKRRKETVKPVFGILKRGTGFRQFC
jgi:hypothetical protein